MQTYPQQSKGGPLFTLSAIIPNYNHGAYIHQAIDALNKQIPAPDEIIVVDDASTDNSLDMLAHLQALYPRLRIVALDKNGGAINALNRGLHEAKGEYIYFGAADDVTEPGLFEALFPLARAHPQVPFVSCAGMVEDVDTGHKSMRPPAMPAFQNAHFSPEQVRALFKRIDNWILTGSAIIRRDAMLAIGGLNPTLGAMADGYAMRHLAFAQGCCFSPHIGLVWRIRASGLSRTMAGNPAASIKALEDALEMMRADPAFPAWYPEVFARRWRFSIGRIALSDKAVNGAVLFQAVARNRLDSLILQLCIRFYRWGGRFFALGWLFLREYPMAVSDLIVTALRNTWRYKLLKLYPDS